MAKISRKLLLTSAAAVALFATAGVAMAGPEGGVVVGGSAGISQSGTKTDIHQQSDRAILDWRSFDIGAQEHVEFHQPSSSAMALNRIRDSKPSQIDGKLSANGHVMLINPNGVVFGSSAQVDVGSLTASTADIDNDDFMAGRLDFHKAGKLDAGIVNHGSITVKEAGLVNFVAPRVENHGVIAARLGKIQLAASDTFALDMAGDGLLQVAVTDDQAAKLAGNTGYITAEGGMVALTATYARTIVDSLVENSGIIEASSMSNVGGKIILGGKDTGVSVNRGVLDASGRRNNVQGGEVNVLGEHIAIAAGSLIDASGNAAVPVPKDKPGTATMSADKQVKTEEQFLADDRRGGGSIKIGGDYLGTGETPRAQSLYVDENSLTLNDALTHGDSGRTIFWSDHTTDFNGLVLSRGGTESGNGGFLETSGKINLKANGFADLSPAAEGYSKGTYLLDPDTITIYGNQASVFNNGGLTGHWTFDEGAGITAADNTNNRNGTLAGGTTWSTDIAPTPYNNEYSVFFDGINSRIGTTATLSNLMSSTTGSVSMWLKPTGASPNILGQPWVGAVAGDEGGWFGIIRGQQTDDTVSIYSYDTNSDQVFADYTLGVWTHITLVKDAGAMTMYKDGVLVNSVAAGPTGDTSRLWSFGQTNPIYTYYSGFIDDTRVYNTALSANEAAELSGAGFTVNGLEAMSATANIVLQATNDITLDLQNDVMVLDTGRSISLTSTSGNIIDVSSGTIRTDNGNISLTATSGNITLDTTNLEALNGGQVSFSATGGDINLTQTSTLNLGSVSGKSVSIQTTGAASDITLNSTVTATDSGNALTIATGRNFINNAGSSALDTGAGQYLVYTDSPSVTNKGGLSGGNLYNRTYAGNAPATIKETGDLFLYAYQPTLSFIANDITLNTFNPNFTNFTYTVSGLETEDTLSSVFAGMPAFSKSQQAPGVFGVNGSLGSLASLIGYDFAFVPGTLTMLSPSQKLNSTVEFQMQTPDLWSGANTGYTLTYADNGFVSSGESSANTTSLANEQASHERRVQIRRNGQRMNNSTSSENDAAVHLVEANLLEIEQPIIEFYDLCSYNIKYCQ